MKQAKKYSKKLIIAALLFGLCVLSVGTAWATISFIKADEVSPPFVTVEGSQIPDRLGHEAKSRAPEPATVAMFGGGLLSMLMAFIRRTYVIIKQIFDSTVAVIGAVLISPLLLILAVLVKITSNVCIFGFWLISIKTLVVKLGLVSFSWSGKLSFIFIR